MFGIQGAHTSIVMAKVTNSGANKVAKAAWRVYECLATFVLAKHLNPHAIVMDYGRLANLADYIDIRERHESRG